ncbi:MAG: hypothetical protein ACRYFZ_07585 [Janthinobacterium lividum]
MKSRRLTIWLLSGLCTFAGASCKKSTTEPDPDAVQVSYAQTQCADPWGLTTGNQQLRDAAVAYIKAKGVTTFPLTVSTAGPMAICTACTCPTGVVLTGTARKTDLVALQAIGFVQI